MAEMDLQTKINNMLAEIPEYGPEDHRREHAISRHDARWLANMMLLIVEAGGCNLGITAEQAIALKSMKPDTIRELSELTPNTMKSIKDMVKERRRILALLGAIIMTGLAYVGQMALNVFDAHFWKTVLLKLVGGN